MPEKVQTDLFNELPIDLMHVLVFDPETGEFELTENATEEEKAQFDAYKKQQSRSE